MLNPFVIALCITLDIVFCLPNTFNKYEVKKVSTERVNIGNIVYYHDLDDDGYSEKIETQLNKFGNASYVIFNSNGDQIDQFNYDTKFPNKYQRIWFQDIDQNGYSEIYTLTVSQDSIFLGIFEPLKNHGINRQRLYVDTIQIPEKDDYGFGSIRTNSFYEIHSDWKEIIFSISAGFAANPRSIYMYDFENDKIYKSPHLTNPASFSHVLDIDGDSKNEILINTSAAANTIDSIYSKRSDYSTWLKVLDDDMSFMFNPIEFKALGAVSVMPGINNKNLIAFFKSRQSNVEPSKLMVLNNQGVILKEKELPEGFYNMFCKTLDNKILLPEYNTGTVMLFDFNLNETQRFQINKSGFGLYYCDLNNDGNKEWFLQHSDYKNATIYSPDFKHATDFKIADEGEEFLSRGYIKKGSQGSFYIQQENQNLIFSYQNNPWYPLRYVMYFGIYLLVLGLIWLVLKGQKLRLEKKRAIEKEIAELQIKTIKNQVDPHFVFNAINTISEMTLADNKIEADTFICRFSDFMRQTLQSSDKITTILKDELNYTENFIKLQQIRFNNSFKYELKVDDNVDLNFKVPKHVLFTYVENAIKHGLALNPNNGLLKIEIKKEEQGLVLLVEDNGAGLRPAKKKKVNSTGNGLLIMERIFELYGTLYNRKIIHKLQDLNDVSKGVSGLRVEVLITKSG